jgi:hypothetical protein
MAKDDESGCFEELGWVGGFDVGVTVTRAYTWKVGEDSPQVDVDSYDGSEGCHDLDIGDEGGGVMQEGGMLYPCYKSNPHDRVSPYHDG